MDAGLLVACALLVPIARMTKHGSARGGRDDSLTMFQNAMNNLLHDIFQSSDDGPTFLGPQNSGYVPLIDVAEGSDDFILTVEVPGVAEGDLRLAVRKDKLIVEGTKRLQSEEKGRRFRHTERVYGFFRRSIPIPSSVDHAGITARMLHGVLTVVMPKANELTLDPTAIDASDLDL
jgi:HSP20 family protein